MRHFHVLEDVLSKFAATTLEHVRFEKQIDRIKTRLLRKYEKIKEIFEKIDANGVATG